MAGKVRKLIERTTNPRILMGKRFGEYQQHSECRYLDCFGKFPRKGPK